jgi:hypothetical protein
VVGLLSAVSSVVNCAYSMIGCAVYCAVVAMIYKSPIDLCIILYPERKGRGLVQVLV